MVHEARIGLEGFRGLYAASARVGGEGFSRALGTEEATEQELEVVHGRAAAPEAGTRRHPSVPKGVHEHGRLAVLRGARAFNQRDADVTAYVDEHAPEQAVGNIVKAIKPE